MLVDKNLPFYSDVMDNLREQVSSKRFSDSDSAQFIKFVSVDSVKQRAFVSSLLSTDEPVTNMKVSKNL